MPEADEKSLRRGWQEMLVSEPAAQEQSRAVQLLADVERLLPATGAQTTGRFIAIGDLTEVVAALPVMVNRIIINPQPCF